jgi:predicted O-linked N-acetylglucosamine transferase (SPINDLY family)
LHGVGLDELVTTSQADYHALARDLALDRPRLEALRAKLEENRLNAPLFDTSGFTRDLERLYAGMLSRANLGDSSAIVLEAAA